MEPATHHAGVASRRRRGRPLGEVQVLEDDLEVVVHHLRTTAHSPKLWCYRGTTPAMYPRPQGQNPVWRTPVWRTHAHRRTLQLTVRSSSLIPLMLWFPESCFANPHPPERWAFARLTWTQVACPRPTSPISAPRDREMRYECATQVCMCGRGQQPTSLKSSTGLMEYACMLFFLSKVRRFPYTRT